MMIVRMIEMMIVIIIVIMIVIMVVIMIVIMIVILIVIMIVSRIFIFSLRGPWGAGPPFRVRVFLCRQWSVPASTAAPAAPRRATATALLERTERVQTDGGRGKGGGQERGGIQRVGRGEGGEAGQTL